MARYHKTEKGGLHIAIRAFPADLCLDRFAELQSICIGELSVFFGSQDGSKMSQTQVAEAITSAVTSLSRTLDGKTFKQLREMVADPEYVSINRGDTQPVRMSSEALAKNDVTSSELLYIIVEAVKYQFGELFTQATELTGLGSFQSLIGRLSESLRTGQNVTAPSGD